MNLPDGFVLDAPAPAAGVPDGFVLDGAPSPSTAPTPPDGFELDHPSQSILGAMGNQFAQEAVSGVAHAAQGGAAVANTLPPTFWLGPGGIPSQSDIARNAALARRPAAQKMEDIQSDPLYQWGKGLAEAAPETYPVDESKAQSLPVRTAGMAGGFLPLVASGPAAPAVIGAQSIGQHINDDFEAFKKQGLTEEEAAAKTMNRAFGSGLMQSTIFAVLPKPLRAAGEKWIVERAGESGLARFLAGRAVTGVEGAALGGASRAAENVVQDRPLLEGTGPSALGMAAMNVVMPPYGFRKPQTAGRQEDNTQAPQATSSEAPSTAQTPADEILDRIRKNVVPPTPPEQAPASKADVADLSQQVKELQAALQNPFKPSEPTPPEPPNDETSQPEAGTTVSPAPVALQKEDAAAFADYLADKDEASRAPRQNLEVIQQGLGDSRYSVVDTDRGEVLGSFGSKHLAEEHLANLQGNRQIDVEAKVSPDPAALTPPPESASVPEAAPVTDTVRTAPDESNASQKGQFPAEPDTVAAPGVTAEPGESPGLGAADSSGRPGANLAQPGKADVGEIPTASLRRKVSRADAQRPPDLIDEIEGEVGHLDPSLFKTADSYWRPTGAARKLFRKGGVAADSALDAMRGRFGVTEDTGLDEFGDMLNEAANARKKWRQDFYKQERQINEEAGQTLKFQKDVGQQTKNTQVLVPDDLNKGDVFTLKGAKFKVKRLEYDEDGRVTHLTLDDGKTYGTQEVDGQTALRMDKGSLVPSKAKADAAPPWREKADALADKMEGLKTGVGKGGQLHAFGLAADLWDKAVSLAQGVIRAGGSVADAINAAVQHIKDNFKGDWDEDRARAFLERNIPTDKDWKAKQADVESAAQRLKDAIHQVANRPAGMSKSDAIQAKNLAAAAFRNLQHDLLTSPDYAEHLLTRDKEITRQLNALLEPAGVRARPDFMAGREEKIQAALSDPEWQRVQNLNAEWERIHSEIKQMPKKLVGAIANKLYPPEPTTGATRAEIPSDWLKAHLGDNPPVEDVKDMTTFGDKVKDAVESLPTNAREAYRGAVKFTQQLKAKFKTLPNRDTISAGKDAADNKATIFSRQTANVVLHELNRAFGVPLDTRNTMREQALTMAIEAGDKQTLALMRDTIDSSEHRGGKWAKEAKAAIDYAEKHWDRFEPVRDLYHKITDAQVASENASGIATLHREGGYVFHLQDLNADWAHMDMAEGGGGASAPFKHVRDHATYADAIAAGVSPKSLNAVDLLQRRVALGQKLINYRAWQEGLKHFTDPTTELPLSAPVITRARADGTTIDSAPQGYKLVQFAGQKLAVHKGYAGLFEALTGESFFRKNEAGAMLMKAVTTAKHGMLLFDTFHLGRLAYWNAITRGAGEGAGALLPGNPFSHKGGLTLLDSTVADIRKMGATGEIPREMADRLIAQRATLDRLINAGLNVGGAGDNIHSDWIQKLPVAGQFNRWLFEKFQRGAMTECALMEFERQKDMHPELTDDQVARMTAKAVNVRFGNLNSQSVIKSKSFQDLARIAFLAPQWNESLLRAEMGAVKDAGAFAKGLTEGRLKVGTLGRAVATAFIGQFIANQLINLYTRGTPTWENLEEGADAKLSAWIPDKLGHSSGFFLNPLTLPAEMSHLMLKGYERTGRLDKAALEATTSRFSSLGRFMETLYTGHDREGNVANNTTERLALAAKTAAPLPLSGSAIYRFGKQLVTGQPEEKYPGQFQRQAMQTVGLKPDTAPTPEGRMYNLAREFNQGHGVEDKEESYHRPYAALDSAIKTGNMVDAKKELQNLLQSKEASTILRRYEQRTAGRFTGQTAREQQFYATLNAEQREQYRQAIAERQRVAQTVRQLLSQAHARN